MAKISILIGPPGCGKTTALSTWCERAVSRYGYDAVLVCSLTRTAAYRAAHQIELPYQQFGTVHAFAYRALGQPVLTESKLAEWNLAYPSLALSGHGRAHTPDDGYLFPEETTEADVLELAYSRLRTMGIPRNAFQWQSTSLAGFAERWEDWKTQNHYVDFVDLLDQAYQECDTAPGEPAVILGDEWQDVGALEHRLIMKWAEKTEYLVLAADPAQSLFQFRGTDPLLVQRLWDEHDPTRQPLDQSYRLPRTVYDYAWSWQCRFRETRRVQYHPRKDDHGQVVEGVVRRGPAFGSVTPRVIEQTLLPYLDAGKTVLIQATCGYMLDPVIRVLRDMGIPFGNHLRPNHGRWNPLPQKRGRGFTIIDRVLAFTRPRVDLWGEHARFWTVGEVKAWAAALPATGIFSRGGSAAIQHLADDASDETIAEAFSRWFTLETLSCIVPCPDVAWYMAHVKGSESFRAYIDAVITRSGVQALQERPLVQVGTVHSYKGGEADVVWLSPDLSMEASGAAHRDVQAREELCRTFYVGVTRARETLLLANPSTRNCVRWS